MPKGPGQGKPFGFNSSTFGLNNKGFGNFGKAMFNPFGFGGGNKQIQVAPNGSGGGFISPQGGGGGQPPPQWGGFSGALTPQAKNSSAAPFMGAMDSFIGPMINSLMNQKLGGGIQNSMELSHTQGPGTGMAPPASPMAPQPTEQLPMMQHGGQVGSALDPNAPSQLGVPIENTPDTDMQNNPTTFSASQPETLPRPNDLKYSPMAPSMGNQTSLAPGKTMQGIMS